MADPADPALADRRRRLVPVAAAAAAVAAALLLAALGLRGSPPVRLVLSPWFEGDGPALESNALVAIALVVISVLGLVAALRALSEDGAAAAPLAVCAAAALMAAAGTERLGLVFAWIVLDATLALVGGGRQGLMAGQAGLFMLLAGLTGTRRFYLEAASLVRSGMYPLWWSCSAQPPGRHVAGDRHPPRAHRGRAGAGAAGDHAIALRGRDVGHARSRARRADVRRAAGVLRPRAQRRPRLDGHREIGRRPGGHRLRRPGPASPSTVDLARRRRAPPGPQR